MLAIAVVAAAFSTGATETPEYQVIEVKDGYEIREYAPHLVAEVEVSGPYREALNTGFRKLADFIFGNNTVATADPLADPAESIARTRPTLQRRDESAKIAMTAPVLERDEAADTHVVAFVMPSQYTLETLPRPNNPDVRIVEVPARRYAVLQFSGRATEDRGDRKKQELREMVERDGLKPLRAPLLAQYNPPWTPPFMRRNEVWLEVEAGPDAAEE